MMSGLKLSSFWQVSLIAATLFCIMMAVGCTSSTSPQGIPAGNATVSPTPTTGNPTQAPVQCPQEINSSFTIIQGDPFSFAGPAPAGNISEMRVWIFGHNSTSVATVPVQQSPLFLFNLTDEQTSSMINGTYLILFEFPSPGNKYSMSLATVGKWNDTVLYDSAGNKVLDVHDITDNYISGFAAAATLEQAIQETGAEHVANITLTIKAPEIEIDPMPDHTIGDIISFGGTTNLHPGENLSLGIMSAEFIPCPKMVEISDGVCTCCGGLETTIAVSPGNCGNNTWSWSVNTSQHNFQPDSAYVLFATGRTAQASVLFNILDVPKSDPFHYVTINQPFASANGNAILLSGTASTDFGPNDKFLVQITSDSGATVSSVVPAVYTGREYGWNYTVNLSTLSPVSSYAVNITSVNNARIWNGSVFTV
jgi:hypothetical protein